jgi:hypothetical protein
MAAGVFSVAVIAAAIVAVRAAVATEVSATRLLTGPVSLLAIEVLVSVAEVPNYDHWLDQRLRLVTELEPLPMEILLETVSEIVLHDVLRVMHDPHVMRDLI